MHAGVDIGAPAGARIYAPRPGIVTLIGRDSDGRGGGLYGYGNAVVLYHPDERLYSFYAHLSRVLVEEGANVAVGQPVGVIGATTNGKFPRMGRHLHMEVRQPKEDGSQPFPGAYGRYNIDPAIWLSEHGIGFSRDGMTASVALDACPSPTPANPGLEWLRRDPYAEPTSPRNQPPLFTRSLGAQIWAIRPETPRVQSLRGLGAPAEPTDPNADYEPPVPDADFYRELKPIIKAIPLAALFTIGAAGVLIAVD